MFSGHQSSPYTVKDWPTFADAPIQRFIQMAEMKVAELGDKIDGAEELRK
jgi:hypothetical protein